MILVFCLTHCVSVNKKASSSPELVERDRIAESDTILFTSFEDTTLVGYASAGYFYYNTVREPSVFQFHPIWYNTSHRNSIYQIPRNAIGNQLPHTGESYVSFMTRDFNAKQRWILTFDLGKRIQKDSIYSIEFFVSQADNLDSCEGYFNIAFSQDQINTLHAAKACEQLQTRLTIENPSLFCNKTDWVKVSFLHKAFGDERYLYIGNLNQERFAGNDVHVIYYLDDIVVRRAAANRLE